MPDALDLPSGRTPLCHCPVCGHHLNAATPVEGDPQPQPGDFTVCLYCTSFLVYEPDLTVREMSEEEVYGLEESERRLLMRARRAIQRFAKAHPS